MRVGLSRERALSAYAVLAGGCAGAALFAEQWLAFALFVVVYLALALDMPLALLWMLARSYAGLTLVVPVGPLDDHRRLDETRARKHTRVAVEALRKAVEPCREVDLLLASGFKVIGWDRDPGWLHATLAAGTDRRLRVLLLKPDCDVAHDRGQRVMRAHGAPAYAEGSAAVLWTLKRWRDDLGVDMEVKLYQEAPIWQMVLTDQELWLMAAGQVASDYSPHFVLRRQCAYGLAWGLEAVFDRRWNHDLTEPVDWSAIGPPDGAKVIAMPNLAWE